LWELGAQLALTYNSNETGVGLLVGELLDAREGSDASDISTHKVDLEDPAAIAALFSEIEAKYGRTPDILVSNAGYGKRIPHVLDIPLDEFDKMININVRPSLLLCQGCIPGMAARGWGRLVSVSSVAGHGGGINGCHYAASKAALVGMMRNLARRHAGEGITANDVAPAMIGDTGLIPRPEVLAGTPGDVRNIPVGRLGRPDEVANVVTMFCRTGYMTGQSILLSGGLH